MPSNLPIISILYDPTVAPPAAPGAATARALDSGDGRGVAQVSWARGRQQELGEARTGTASVVVDDPQETLNPANTASPLLVGGGKLALNRPLQVVAWWPRTGNMQDPANYSGRHPGYEDGERGSWVASGGGGIVSNVDNTTPHSGTRCLRVTVPSGAGGITASWWTIPGRRHVASVWVRVAAALPGTVRLAAVTASGTTLGTSTTSTDWTRLQVAFTPDRARTTITLTSTTAAGWWLDEEQLELGDQPTDWVATGPKRRVRFTGFVERYPQTWEHQGFRGVRPLQAMDALGILEGRRIRSSYREAVEASDPTVWLPLDDPNPPGQAETGLIPRRGEAVPSQFIAPRGGSVGWAADTLPDGSKAVAITQQLQDPADVPWAQQVTAVDTRSPTGASLSQVSLNTGAATLEWWARIDPNGSVAAQFQSVGSGDFNVGGSYTGGGGGSTGDGGGGTTGPAEAAVLRGWGTKLSTSDEFNVVGTPNPALWGLYDGAGHNGNGTRDPERIAVISSGGDTFMRMTGLPGGSTGGMAHTLNRQYGRWEAQIRWLAAPGATGNPYHPVLIVWPASNIWPNDGEYDFVENNIGQTTPEAWLHYPHPNLPVEQEHATYPSSIDTANWFNVGFEWTSAHVRGFINGVQWFSFSNGAGPNGRGNMQAMPSGHFTAQLDNFFGAGGMQQAYLDINWVRLYNL